jgi:hypothetical protein
MSFSQSDLNRGREAMVCFHNASVGRGDYNFRTVDALIERVGGANPQIFLDGLGFAINTVRMSSGDLDDAMTALAQKSGGKVPNPNSFFSYISNQATKISYLDLSKDVASHVVSETASGLQKVGESVLFTGNLLVLALPLIVGYIVYSNVRKVA